MTDAVLLIPYLFLVFWAAKLTFAGILRIASPELGLQKDYSFTPSVVVLVSCYNEGEAIYATLKAAGESNYPKDKFKILAFDDCSKDDTWEWMQMAADNFECVTASRNAVNKGKAITIGEAIRNSTSDIIITIDSDTQLDANAIREMIACFSDPKIALVGGAVKLINPNENSLTAFQAYVYAIFFHWLKLPEAYLRQVAVISGCMSAIRRSVFEEIEPAIEKRNFLGVSVRYGEDRFITHQTLLRGYQTFFNPRAICWTTAPNTFEGYWGQQIRWARSGLGDSIKTITHPYSNTVVGTLALTSYLLTTVTLPIMMCSFWLSLSSDPASSVTAKCLMCAGSAIVVVWFMNFFSHMKANPIKVVGFATWGLIKVLFLVPSALFTLDFDGWGGARNKNDEKGSQ